MNQIARRMNEMLKWHNFWSSKNLPISSLLLLPKRWRVRASVGCAHDTPSHLRIFVTIILPKNISHNPIKNIAFIHSIILQQWNLTRLISTLSGKAVLPLVSNPQMTESSGQITKLVQTLFGTQCVSPAASKFVPSSHIKLTPHVPASSEDHKVMGRYESLKIYGCVTRENSLIGLVVLLAFFHEPLGCTQSFIVPFPKRPFVFSNRWNIIILSTNGAHEL